VISRDALPSLQDRHLQRHDADRFIASARDFPGSALALSQMKP